MNMNSITNGDGFYDDSNKNASNNKLRNNTGNPYSIMFVCKFCNDTFIRPQDLIFHKKQWHMKELQSIVQKQSVLDENAKKLEETYRSNVSTTSTNQSSEHVDETKTASSKKAYSKTHMKPTESNKRTETQNVKLSDHIFPQNKISTSHKCQYCRKIYRGKSTLQDHENMHTGARPYECRYCLSTFAWASYLKYHEVRCKLKKAPVSTSSMSKTKPSQAQSTPSTTATTATPKTITKRHGKKTSSNLRSTSKFHNKVVSVQKLRNIKNARKSQSDQLQPVSSKANSLSSCQMKCGVCHRIIYQSSWDDHQNMHTGNRPHKCHKCGNGYAWSSYLKYHEKRCSGIPIPKIQPTIRIPVKQEVQKSMLRGLEAVDVSSDSDSGEIRPKAVKSSAYTRAGSIQIKKLVSRSTSKISKSKKAVVLSSKKPKHKPLFSIHDLKNVSRHWVNGKMHMSCNFCKKTVINSSNMIVHMRIHTGERPYKCHFCDYSSTTLQTIQRHEKRTHGYGNANLPERRRHNSK